MKVLLKQAHIINDNWDSGKTFDIAIKSGKIESISAHIDDEGYKVIKSENLHVCLGLMDIGTQIGEPGLEHREDLESIIKAASSGGYTALAPFPNTEPTIHSKSEVQYIINNTKDSGVAFYPVGAVSKSCEGEDITEIIDMNRHGAVAFSDGKKSVQDSGLMLRALQYSKACDGLIINHPDDKSLSHNGQIHEGKVSVSLGLEGLPEIAEILGLTKDIELADYAESQYCAYNISSRAALKFFKKEKELKAAKLYCTVSYLNLLFDDRNLADFNVNLKVYPPIRSERDKKSLLKGVIDGSIDAITSGHTPLEEEMKKMSFAFASFGAIGIETVFPALLTYTKPEDLSAVISKLTVGPRNILGLEIPQIKIGENANLCVFDPDKSWTYKKDNILSKSANSPFINTEFKGKVLATIYNNKLFTNS